MDSLLFILLLALVILMVILIDGLQHHSYKGGLEVFTTPFRSALELPEDLPDLAEKVRYIKKKIYKKLPYDVEMKPYNETTLPDGLCVFKGNLNDGAMNNLHKGLEYIFANLTKFKLQHDIADEKIFLFGTGDVQKWHNAQKELRRVQPAVAQYVKSICTFLQKKFNIPQDIIDNGLKFTIIKYTQERGIKLHLDNVTRTTGGPIITMNVGPEYIYIDLVSVVSDDDPSYRVRVDKGELLLMDGASRLHYAHALPYGFRYNKPKYTVLFLFDKFAELDKKHSDYFDVDISKSVNCTDSGPNTVRKI